MLVVEFAVAELAAEAVPQQVAVAVVAEVETEVAVVVEGFEEEEEVVVTVVYWVHQANLVWKTMMVRYLKSLVLAMK